MEVGDDVEFYWREEGLLVARQAIVEELREGDAHRLLVQFPEGARSVVTDGEVEPENQDWLGRWSAPGDTRAPVKPRTSSE